MRKGFTLLEVLVATLIMAIAVTALMSNLTTSLNNASKLTEYDRLTIMARRKMDELIATRALPRGAPFGGMFEAASAGGLQCGWQAQVAPFETLPNAGPGTRALERIDLEVWWLRGSDRKSLRIEGYRAGSVQPQDVAAAGGLR